MHLWFDNITASTLLTLILLLNLHRTTAHPVSLTPSSRHLTLRDDSLFTGQAWIDQILSRNDEPFIGPDWIPFIGPQTYFLPVASAAHHLVSFYENIAITAALQTTPPLNHFTYIDGLLGIEFSCLQPPIPWALVIKVANQLRDFAARGWTAGEWDLQLLNEVTGTIILVSFKLLGPRFVNPIAGLEAAIGPGGGDGAIVGESRGPSRT